MKICIVSQTFAPQAEGGAEMSSRHAAQNLAARHDVVVLALGLAGSGATGIGEQPIKAPYRVHRLAFRNAYLPEAQRPDAAFLTRAGWHLRNALGAVSLGEMRHFLQREGFDLIYAQNSSRMQPALYRAAAELDIPVVQHLRDYALLCPRTSMYRGGRNCDRPCGACRALTARARWASGSVGTAIAVSDFVRQRFLRHGLFQNAKFHVLHNTNTARKDFDQDLLAGRPAPQEPFTFGYLGALSAEKGLIPMIDAFLSLPPDRPARLLVAGKGQEAFVAQLKARARGTDRIEWLGHVRPEAVFARAEAIIVPSLWHEPQSRVLIEAASYGLPLLASRRGGSTEIVEGGRLGWCYDGSSEGLAALMRDAVQGGPADWRKRLPTLFPGLPGYAGWAEAAGYYDRLDRILREAVEQRDAE